MLLGCVISFLGVALVLGLTIYYITLPVEAPLKEFFNTNFLGISYLLYFAIVGSIITVIGLITFIKAARSVEAMAQPGIITRQPTRVRAVRPGERMRRNIEGGVLVEEIEREIEEIVKSGEEVVGEEVEEVIEEEEKPKDFVEVEVVTSGTDMVCPSCGALNPLRSMKCSSCKKPLFKVEKEGSNCPVCGAPLKLARKISSELFICGLCFSELKIPSALQEKME